MRGRSTTFTPIHARDLDKGFRVASEAFEAAAKRGADDDVLSDIFYIMMREHKVACAAEFADRPFEGSA